MLVGRHEESIRNPLFVSFFASRITRLVVVFCGFFSEALTDAAGDLSSKICPPGQ